MTSSDKNSAGAQAKKDQAKKNKGELSAGAISKIPVAERTPEQQAAFIAQRDRRRLEKREAKRAAARTRKATEAIAALPPAPPPAPPARVRQRHRVIFTTFILLVIMPMVLAFWYLDTRAVDQYHSALSFSVRKEQTNSALDITGILPQLGGSGSNDSDVLYEYIQSQELMSLVDQAMDLRATYSEFADRDPIFSLTKDATIEDLVAYWPRMIRTYYDRGAGIIELRVLAFEPEKARAIAREILRLSTEQINKLSQIARDDTMRYAQEELDVSVVRLTKARQAMTDFRLRTQIVDPFADVQGQMGLMNTLQAELATTLIELGLLQKTAREGDPRIANAERRIDVIRAQIEAERAKFGVGGEGPGGEDFATLVAEFEKLKVDREFAEQAYKSALTARDAALAEAQRQSRYLAAHVEPTLAESPEYPQRYLLLGIALAFLVLFWAVSILIFYSIRDRR